MAAIGAAAIMAVPAFAAAPAAPAATPAAAPVPVPVTEEQAKAIALEKAGFTEEQVRRMKVEKDYDDGRLEYDVEFYVNGVEYSCDIDILRIKDDCQPFNPEERKQQTFRKQYRIYN